MEKQTSNDADDPVSIISIIGVLFSFWGLVVCKCALRQAFSWDALRARAGRKLTYSVRGALLVWVFTK